MPNYEIVELVHHYKIVIDAPIMGSFKIAMAVTGLEAKHLSGPHPHAGKVAYYYSK